MALTTEMIKLFRKNISDPKLSDEDKKRFKNALDKEGVSYTETETKVEVEEKTPAKKKAPKKKPAKKKAPKKESGETLAKAKADLEAKYKVSVEDCEKLLKEYAEKRAKAKKGREKRTSKLKKDGKLIKGTDVKDAGATLDTAKKKVKEKIKTELTKVEKKEEAKVKEEVKKEEKKQAKTKKPKATQDKEVKKVEKKEEKKAEKEVEKETEKVAKKLVFDTSAIINAISSSLADFDKNSSKEFLQKLRDDIDKLLAKYGAGGFTQQLNITQSNLSASSVNPFKFKKGGDVEFFGQKYKKKGGDIEYFGQKYKKKGGIVDKFSKAYDDLIKELGFKKKGGDIEFFGQKFMDKGGYVVVDMHQKGGGFVMTKPSSKKLADESAKSITKSSDIKERKVMKVEDARKVKNLVGKEYLKKGGDIEFFGQKYKKKGGVVEKFNKAYKDLVKELGFKKGGDIEYFGQKYKKKGGDIQFFGQDYKKKGGDIEFFGQKYKARGGGIRKYKQGYNDRDDEGLAMRRGKHKMQDYRARRDESKGELRHRLKRAYSDVDTMDRGNRYLKKGGDIEYFGQKYKEDGGQVDVGSEMMRMGGKTKNRNWIQKVVDSPNFRKGAFTRKAKERGLTAEEFMKQVLSNPNRYDLRTRRQAQFMKNI